MLNANEHFEGKPDAKSQSPIPIRIILLGYFEAGRRLRMRSILEVCEQSEIKPDAKIANQIILIKE